MRHSDNFTLSVPCIPSVARGSGEESRSARTGIRRFRVTDHAAASMGSVLAAISFESCSETQNACACSSSSSHCTHRRSCHARMCTLRHITVRMASAAGASCVAPAALAGLPAAPVAARLETCTQ